MSAIPEGLIGTMDERPNIKRGDKVGYSARLGARADRSFQALFHTADGTTAASQAPALTLNPEAPLRFERLRRSRFFSLIKGPLLHARNFLTSPVLSRIDGVHGTLGTHQRLIAQTLERTEALEAKVRKVLEGMSATHAQLEAQVARLQETDARIGKVHQSLGFLHVKADDAAIKLRPAMHLNGAFAVPLRDGYLFVPEEEEGLLLMYTGAGPDGLEPGTRRIIQMMTPPGGTGVDVGASVGLHTLALARSLGPSGKLYAFEAEARLEPFLRRTINANGLHQTNLQILAVGAEHGEATFHVARTIGHSSLYALSSASEVREEVKVEIRTLDELIPEEVQVDLIKIDVEGAELDVIRGAKGVLSRSPNCAIIAELGPSHLKRVGISLGDWLQAFEAFGLKAYAIEEPFGEVRRADAKALEKEHSVNMAFVRDGSFAHGAMLDQKVIKAR